MSLAVCIGGASCAHPFRNPFRSGGPPPPAVLVPGATLAQITDAVNQNAARIRSLQTDNASITVPGMLGVPMLSGKIRAQRPGRLRLQAATSLTGPEVDLGANDELFWFWVRQDAQPAVYFARHDQFVGTAASQALPIEPQWLLDAMGFAEFKPTEFHEGPEVRGNALVVRSVVRSASGQQLSKSTVVDAKTACVLEQHIYAPDGRLLASAIARSHRFYPEVGASLPQKIEVQMPAAELQLTIDLGTPQLNNLPDSPQLWTMPVIPGVPQVNLGTSPAGTGGTLGGQLGGADWGVPPISGPAATLPDISPPPVPNGAVPPAGQPPATYSAPLPGTLAPQTTLESPGSSSFSPPVTSSATLPAGGVPAELRR